MATSYEKSGFSKNFMYECYFRVFEAFISLGYSFADHFFICFIYLLIYILLYLFESALCFIHTVTTDKGSFKHLIKFLF